ncbi:MAG: M20/M25/M40 family metallo-hydrolase [Bacteroidales bacterium]
MKSIISLLFCCIIIISCTQQRTIDKLSDNEVIGLIYSEAERSTESYENLRYLTTNYTKRLACYPQSIEAAKWTKSVMEDMNFDKVFLQEAQVMNWKRGSQEIGFIKVKGEKIPVNVCSLGRGIATPERGIEANVVEVNGLEALAQLQPKDVEGKIIFLNQAMNPTYGNPFQAYGEAAGQRFMGPILAAEKGAVGTVIRSLTCAVDTFPHTGVTRKVEGEPTVPSVAIATKHANLLSDLLKENPDLKFYFKTDCKNLPDKISFNTIGEIKGTEFPNEYIVIGGHLDAWDNSPGAHDDGGGCMQAIEVLRLFKELGIKPKHSIRAVMYMDEEISQGGGRAYAEQARKNGEIHIAAIESDRGVDKPLGFSIDTSPEKLAKIVSWSELFKPYDATIFIAGGGGVDIAPLKDHGTVLMGLLTDPTYYFNYHHSANDTFDKINRSDMQKGAATMAALVYLIDKYGI